jgi:hypothetical protein
MRKKFQNQAILLVKRILFIFTQGVYIQFWVQGMKDGGHTNVASLSTKY